VIHIAFYDVKEDVLFSSIRPSFQQSTLAFVVCQALLIHIAFCDINDEPLKEQSMDLIRIDTDNDRQTISRHIYGHFAEHLGRCIYEGIWVGEGSTTQNTRGIRNDVAAALSRLSMPNIRWPGGCFADTYHWKDGIGPRAERPGMVNVHWGGVTENNHFGTHEFMDFCSMIGAEPYICGNVGSGTVREMSVWLEYITMPGTSPMANLRRANGREQPWPITYWAVGNENWGCGGNMTALQYAGEFRRYQGYCRHFGGRALYKIACGFTDDWNEVLMREAGSLMNGLSIHYYTFADRWEHKGAATGFPAAEWYSTMKNALGLEDLINRTAAIMDRHDAGRRVGMIVDEWGTWFDAEPGTNPAFLYQANTIRDAVVAGLSLNIFNRHADRVHMANIAQTVNVLQAMILTRGAKMVMTPSYHVFEMYKVHQDATLLPLELEGRAIQRCGIAIPALSASASRDAGGAVHVSLCNLDAESGAEVEIELTGSAPLDRVGGRVLTAPHMDSCNDFDAPDAVVPTVFAGASLHEGRVAVTLPPMSVVVLELSM
jgi:alpha-N-arabinofuranosidase